MQNVIIFHNSFISSTSNLYFYWFILSKAFPQRRVSSTNIQRSGTDVSAWRCFSCIWQRSGVVVCNCMAQHLRSSNETGKRSRCSVCQGSAFTYATRQNFTVRVKFARLLERDCEKYQVRSFNDPVSLFAQSFSSQFYAEELKFVWSCDRLARTRCAFVGFNKRRCTHESVPICITMVSDE